MLILGMELGSTRIKSVLIDENGNLLAQGGYGWENRLEDGLWSYSLEEAVVGLQASYRELAQEYRTRFAEPLTKVDAIGISGMMHGYIAQDAQGNLLAPFRTWRNTNAQKAGEELSNLFDFHLPMRWSVAQYYQSVLEKMPHVASVKKLNTLAGYIHEKLTGKFVLGLNDASGMFPLLGKAYHPEYLQKFNALLRQKGVNVDFAALLPTPLAAGEPAGVLTEEGAALLDPTGTLAPDALLCPPEGDMGTGMVATGCVVPGSANVSLGTSANITVALSRPFSRRYDEADMIASPDGTPSCIFHANNCTTEINEWVGIFGEILDLAGASLPTGTLFEKLFVKSAESDETVGGLVGYNFLAGEPVAGTVKGMPMVARRPDGEMNLANFMQMQLYAAVAPLALTVSVLEREKMELLSVTGHGGFFKTPFVGQNAVSSVLSVPVTVLSGAGEGGAYGVALLAQFCLSDEKDLGRFLQTVLEHAEKTTVMADEASSAKAACFMKRYAAMLPAERLGSESI